MISPLRFGYKKCDLQQADSSDTKNQHSVFSICKSKENSAGYERNRKMTGTDHEMLHELGQQTVLDENGNAARLSSLWEEQRAVLVLVRHFG